MRALIADDAFIGRKHAAKGSLADQCLDCGNFGPREPVAVSVGVFIRRGRGDVNFFGEHGHGRERVIVGFVLVFDLVFDSIAVL